MVYGNEFLKRPNRLLTLYTQ